MGLITANGAAPGLTEAPSDRMDCVLVVRTVGGLWGWLR